MLTLLLSFLALFVALAACAICWQLASSTRAARHTSPGELLVRIAEIEQEWSSTLEANARFLKKLTQRDKREAEKTVQNALGDANGVGQGRKDQLRALARQRGL